MRRGGEARIPEDIRELLDESGLEWEARMGTRHIKLFLCGRMVQVLSRGKHGRETRRSDLNALSAVRRAIKAAFTSGQGEGTVRPSARGDKR